MTWKLAGAAALALSVAACSSGPAEWFGGSSTASTAPVTSAQYPSAQYPSERTPSSQQYSSNMEHYSSSRHRGSRSVREAQEALSQRGFNPGPIDGIYGPRTSSAVENFQRANNMQPTGRLDRQVEQALNLREGGGTRPSTMTGTDMGTPGATGGGAGSGTTTAPATPGNTSPSH